MSSRSFHSLFMVASCAGAALGCYLVSLRVASERAQLEDVESRIVLAQRDMRVLQTEIGARGRLSQLERWNAGAFALSAPAADQFLKGGFELARLAQPERKADFQAPVVLAAAPAPARRPSIGAPEMDDSGASAAAPFNPLLHQASLKFEMREVPARSVVALPLTPATSTDKPAKAAKPATLKSVAKPGLAAAQDRAKQPPQKQLLEASKPSLNKSVDKPAVGTPKAVTKPVHIAKVDPLAPLPGKHSGISKGSSADR
jgi:hypothetical protein